MSKYNREIYPGIPYFSLLTGVIYLNEVCHWHSAVPLVFQNISVHEKTFPARETEKINYMSQVAYDFIVADREKADVLCLLVTKLREPFVKGTGMLTCSAWGFSTVLALTDCVSEDDRTLSLL